ncbi:MAG: glycosyltransferase [Actinomycetota bacterium]|nr:glycosyltransferase [Actinomycetota bacterium]
MTVVGYASPAWGVHDQRWVEGLRACGFEVEVLSGIEDLAAEVPRRLPRGAPVLAGPLPTLARTLVDSAHPIVGLSHGWDLQAGHAQSVPIADLAWLPRLARLIVDSASTGSRAEAAGMPTDRIHLLPWGIDLDRFEPDGEKAALAGPADARIVLSLRTHDRLYRTADVIEAFALAASRDPALFLVMGGTGPLANEHRERLHGLGLADRVAFPGQVDETAVAPLLRAADCYVTASETDGTSVTLLQAMACRVPVVCSRNPGNGWWIEDGVTGHTFDVGDIDRLAELMATATVPGSGLDQARANVVERADWRRNRLMLAGIMGSSTTTS